MGGLLNFPSPPERPAFQIPKLVRHSGKENAPVDQKDATRLILIDKNMGNHNTGAVQNSILSVVGPSKVIPNLKALSIPSLTPKIINSPPMPSMVSHPYDGFNNSNLDSDDEGSSLSALIAQHACKSSSPEHTSLSALAEQHLKSSTNSASQIKSEFVIPTLKAQSKLPCSGVNMISAMPQEPRLENDDSCNDKNYDSANIGVTDENVGFVFDLLGALNPPDIRKQLERPRSRMNGEMDGGIIGDEEEQDEQKTWVQDRTCVLDARPVLSLNFPMEVKSSSPLGRVICRRRFVRKLPYVRPSSPFFGDIVPFAFDTPSPDVLIKKHLRRL